MRSIKIGIAVVAILLVVGLRPLLSSGAGAAPISKFKVVYSFTGGSDGGNPLSDLTLDAEGNLYGTTSTGGSGGYGTVFELKHTKEGWEEQVLYSFMGGKDGWLPAAGVIFDASGNLYGTTFNGGGHFYGTVFKLTPTPVGDWKKTDIYDFGAGLDGDNPAEDLVFDTKGNLLGTTSTGAAGGCDDNAGCGTVFELTPQSDGSWTETTIHAFDGAPDSGVPASALVADSSGNFYGATQFGGTGKCYDLDGDGCGTVYKLSVDDNGNWTETKIYDFFRGGGFARYPTGNLIWEEPGRLLGMADGGDGPGTIFELRNTQLAGWKQNVFYRFYGGPDDGDEPLGRLVTETNGNLFGVTAGGGSGFAGTVFELTPLRHGFKERVRYSFTVGSGGDQPKSGLLFSQGHLYGTTQFGGVRTCTGGCGTVYEFTP